MPRSIQDRELNIVHFSFFDLLFGAFGAFVFLMLMQVISTINLVDAGTQQLIEQTVEEKNVLKQENARLKGVEQSLVSMKERYESVQKENNGLRETIAALQQRAEELGRELAAYRDKDKSFADGRKQLEDTQAQVSDLQKKLAELAAQKEAAEKQGQALRDSVKALEDQVARLGQAKDKDAKQAEVISQLEAKINDLNKANAAANQEKAKLAQTLAALEQKSKDYEKERASDKNRGDVLTSLEAKNKQLEKDLAEAKKKIASVARAPLEIMTTAIPALPQGDEVNFALAAQGGSPPFAWSLEGQLPEGMLFDSVKGMIFGRPQAAGKFDIKVQVSDAVGGKAGEARALSLEVTPQADGKAKVSPWFLAMTVFAGLLLAYIGWGKHKARKYFKEMVAKGYSPEWVKRG